MTPSTHNRGEVERDSLEVSAQAVRELEALIQEERQRAALKYEREYVRELERLQNEEEVGA